MSDPISHREACDEIERRQEALLRTHSDDECCGARISLALREGHLDGKQIWLCPVCGLEWRARRVAITILGKPIETEHWAPHCPVEILR